MEYLFKPTNLELLESITKNGALFAFDFDGTLAPIVEIPSEAKMNNRVEALLKELNEKVPLALITGRSLADISQRISFKPKYLIGNHGIEGSMSEDELNHIKKLCQNWIKYLNEHHQSELEKLDARIEDKTYSLTIHYRNSKVADLAKQAIPAILKNLNESKVSIGKSVFNVTPLCSVNKGEALERLMISAGLSSAFFIGDDLTDEDVFIKKNPNIFTVRVMESKSSAARFYMEEQAEIEKLIENLLQFVS